MQGEQSTLIWICAKSSAHLSLLSNGDFQSTKWVVNSVLSSGLGYAVSDGSFKDERGSAAWIIECPTSALRLTGQVYTPGHATDHSSFRSEVVGIIGTVYTLTYWPPVSTKLVLRLACDGLLVINRLSNNHPIDPTEPHADLLQAAWTLINTSAYMIQLKFVRGHQDNSILTALTRDAWLNIEANKLAKQKLTSPHTRPILYKLLGNPWSCYVGTVCIVKQLHQSLQKTINGQDTIQYWEQWKKLTPAIIQTVDWIAFGRVMQEIPQSKCRWVSKQTSGHFAHRKNTVRWHQRTTAECPQCRVTQEDKTHIITCPQQEATDLWTSAISSLKTWLIAEGTDPLLITKLVTGLEEWQSGGTVMGTLPVTQKQSVIGWEVVMDGWLGLEWRAQQEAYWSIWRHWKSSRCWATELIKKLWNISWDMWDHHNGILHNTSQLRDDILDSTINDQVHQLFSSCLQAVPRDTFNLFAQPVEELVSKPRQYKIQWVASVEVAITWKRHHDYGSYLLEQHFMRWCLGLE